MRILIAALLVAFTALIGAPVRAADLTQYPEVTVPDVDYGVQGGFYLRGSAAANMMWAGGAEHYDVCGCLVPVDISAAGYGYSVGAGFGYETGNGLRYDATLDYLNNAGLSADGDTLTLRSTIALANAYYDFNLGNGGSANGGFGAYVGGGLGGGYMMTHLDGAHAPTPDGANFAPVGAVMAGITYDAGNWVADVGYRGLYIPQISNGDASTVPYYVNQNMIHEVRGTIRYRLQ
jgi:hypothetical protein